ncbi:hypothetical protein B0H15DRAFT_787274 [Mycena belliarum]|uniref:XRRM domain-containing protein n=1 Tax=Mycena belliarum TaxID=1033014 RepID=A0AAD6TUT6_9AGAR|nr:hypothetical protein B0H15DRAFT_787274 [Mycena belliae]
MSASFAFVPRKVAKAAKAPYQHVVSAPLATVSVVDKGKSRETSVERRPGRTLEAPTKSQYSEEDYALLLCLSLSKRRLWSDPDLRRDIEWSSRESANDGFFPLSYLLDSPCPLSSTHASETLIIKALRTHATDVVDVRMAIPSSSSGQGKTRGNFEIRPKFWDDAVYPVSREGWDNRTVYVENIPVRHKTVPAFFRFILGLLPANSAMPAHNRIQWISLPSHHSDEPGAEAKPKAFALITFATSGDAESLLTAWPWARRAQHEHESSDASEAAKFGFRTLSMARWEGLNAEYLSYRAKLLADIPKEEAPTPAAVARPSDPPSYRPEPRPPVEVPVAFASTLPYPRSCLVFVRNIHPETNKTTLRTFFARTVDTKEAIDYVDFNKGMDSCYLRLTTPSHATTLMAQFSENHVVHASGLDDSGCPGQANEKHVEVELVLGKREEVYWEKVPEKVRLQAVQKALGQVNAPPGENDGEAGDGRRRQRKRQKRT